MQRPSHKFDPARAARLDAPERQSYLPDAALISLLDLHGHEKVVDYGAGTGRLSLAAAQRLRAGGQVLAVEESEEMMSLLCERLAGADAPIEPILVAGNSVPLDDATADRILAVNLLHEVRGEPALVEMRRLLGLDGLLLVADWERGRAPERTVGPPDDILYSEEEAAAELEQAGFDVQSEDGLPYHFLLLAHPRAPS